MIKLVQFQLSYGGSIWINPTHVVAVGDIDGGSACVTTINGDTYKVYSLNPKSSIIRDLTLAP